MRESKHSVLGNECGIFAPVNRNTLRTAVFAPVSSMQPQEADNRSAARVAQLNALYAKIHDEDAVRALAKLPFDHDVWLTVRTFCEPPGPYALHFCEHLWNELILSVVVHKVRGGTQ